MFYWKCNLLNAINKSSKDINCDFYNMGQGIIKLQGLFCLFYGEFYGDYSFLLYKCDNEMSTNV